MLMMRQQQVVRRGVRGQVPAGSEPSRLFSSSASSQSEAAPKPAKPLQFMWFIGTKIPPEEWPKKFGDATSKHREDALVNELSLRGEQVAVYHDDDDQSKTISSLKETVSNVWVFAGKWGPVSRRYVDAGDLKAIMNDVANNDGSSHSPSEFTLDTGTVLFVCGHGTRDERCGRKGEPIVKQLRSMGQRAFICSHIGGHAFAGNVISLPSAAWYSKVEDSNAKELISGQFGSVYCRGCSW